MLKLLPILIKNWFVRSTLSIKMSQIHYLFHPNLAQQNLENYFDPAYWKRQNKILGSATGRGVTWFIATEQQVKCNSALRHYYRGGLFGKLIKDHFLFTGLNQCRSIKEFQLLQQLKQKGLPVPTPIAARVKRTLLCYQADILIELIENGRDLVAILQEKILPDDIWRQIGKLIRQLHDQQVFHSDLNAHNILLQSLDNQQYKLWLLDFDKCDFRQGDEWKVANLQRLYRSFQKEIHRYQIQFTPQNWQTLLQGYHSH
ncbi:3-deoxy-D-manno-octulosonic acid kinase [Gallibacterium genomosp. 3]|uniref:3-deoxy-D-manno-octulosonic acid kinase n=2 Tax=Gallibacterium genomosp. 3 TaxID=505345 RepID=A0A1A7NLZ4_9PAST|nr:3-deoxy-D-manno-octulosonic acid kinase [Gallibacterium genomosp. 3]